MTRRAPSTSQNPWISLLLLAVVTLSILQIGATAARYAADSVAEAVFACDRAVHNAFPCP